MKREFEEFSKEFEKSRNDYLVKTTFYITYAFLMTTATITLIEALRTKESKIRNILNLETCISVVAAFFYGRFINEIKEGVDYNTINITRYTDWAITTPIMLLVLVLAFLYNNNGGAMKFSSYIIIFWAFYGVFYYLDEKTKNVGYNVLDLFSKCFVGIFFWAYYSGVFKL